MLKILALLKTTSPRYCFQVVRRLDNFLRVANNNNRKQNMSLFNLFSPPPPSYFPQYIDTAMFTGNQYNHRRFHYSSSITLCVRRLHHEAENFSIVSSSISKDRVVVFFGSTANQPLHGRPHTLLLGTSLSAVCWWW